MKTCPQCGKTCEDKQLFCPACGKLFSLTMPIQEERPQPAPKEETPQQAETISSSDTSSPKARTTPGEVFVGILIFFLVAFVLISSVLSFIEDIFM